MTAQRDIFIQALYEKALLDKNIIFISVDMGAPTLDQWKSNLPDQFIASGIAEQNSINVAAGLAKQGKKVFVYMMASWFSRCIEQVRYSCAMANNPITILGNGVALGYAPSGPAHEPNEDIALS
jgi:transketolase